jgi:hypothetical protein
VAHTTQTSEDRGNWSRPHPMTRAEPTLWFGRRVPEGVFAIQLMRDYVDYQLLVRWRVRDNSTIHEMPFEQTDEGVIAALAAMKLTC